MPRVPRLALAVSGWLCLLAILAGTSSGLETELREAQRRRCEKTCQLLAGSAEMIFLDAEEVPATGALAARLRAEGFTRASLAEVVAQGYLLEVPPTPDLGHEVAGALELQAGGRPAVRCRVPVDP